MTKAREASLFEEEGVIANDRDLLRALGLTDAVAATYVLKSRQTLNNQLGARRDGSAPTDYFKPAELLMLVLAATRDCPEFDEARKEEVREYISRTRGHSSGARQERAYGLVMETLASEGQVDLTHAKGVIFLLPEFSVMEREHEEAVIQLSRIALRVVELEEQPWMLVLSSSSWQAKRAAELLGLEGEELFTAAHDNAEHYMPAVLVYEGGDRARAHVVTARGTLAPAPMYRSPMMLACLREMLPETVRDRLFDREGSRKLARS